MCGLKANVFSNLSFSSFQPGTPKISYKRTPTAAVGGNIGAQKLVKEEGAQTVGNFE
jgi:hypothetical protein